MAADQGQARYARGVPQRESEGQARAQRVAHDVQRVGFRAEPRQAIHFGFEVDHVSACGRTRVAHERRNEAAHRRLIGQEIPAARAAGEAVQREQRAHAGAPTNASSSARTRRSDSRALLPSTTICSTVTPGSARGLAQRVRQCLLAR